MGVKGVVEVVPQRNIQWGCEFEVGVYLVVAFGTELHGGYDGGGGGGYDDIHGTWVEGSV